jgi:hypothetical protein
VVGVVDAVRDAFAYLAQEVTRGGTCVAVALVVETDVV